MNFGAIPVNIAQDLTPSAMIDMAVKAEETGFESIWTFEHTLIPLEYESKYPYSEDGKMGGTDDIPIVDPLIALAAVAQATTTIKLGTGVNVLPQANPVYLAKQTAGLDWLSNGRLLLGLGLGWLEEEFDAIGVPFKRRGARFDDYLVAIRKFWSGETVEHQSEFISWSGFLSHPLPAQKPGPPVIIGGTKGKAFDRIATAGDGWFAPAVTPDLLAPLMKPLEEACERHGRDRSSVEVTTMWFPMMTDLDALKGFEDLGVDRVIVHTLGLKGKTTEEKLERFAEEVIAKQ